MVQTEQQRQWAERQQRRRAKLLAAEHERDEFAEVIKRQATELDQQAEYIGQLEADLEAERSGRHTCRRHGTELACIQCERERGGSWDSA